MNEIIASKAMDLMKSLNDYSNTNNINKITKYIERFRKDDNAIEVCLIIISNSTSNTINCSSSSSAQSILLVLQTLTWLLRKLNSTSSINNSNSITHIMNNLITILSSSSSSSSLACYRPIETQLILSIGACIIKLLVVSMASSSQLLPSLSSIVVSQLSVLQLRHIILILSIIPETVCHSPSGIEGTTTTSTITVTITTIIRSAEIIIITR